jgi:hypothetical protein
MSLKVNFGKIVQSPNYASVLNKVMTTPALQRKLLSSTFQVSDMKAFATDFNISIHEVTQIRMAVSSYKKNSAVQSLNMTVEKKESGYRVGGNNPCSVLGALIAMDKVDTSAIKDRTVSVLLELLNFEKDTINVVPLPVCKSEIQVNPLPAVSVAAQYVESDVLVRSEVQKDLTSNMMKKSNSEILTQTVIDIAPKALELTPVVVAVEGKNIVVPRAKKFEHKDFDEKTAKNILYKQQQLTYPSTSSIAATASRHVHGIPVQAVHKKYYDLLTDLHVPDPVKRIHLYSNDATYAMALHNTYPTLTVAIVGNKNFNDKRCFLSYITKAMAKKELQDQNDSILGIWPLPEDKTQPNNEVKAKAIFETNLILNNRFKSYTYAFQPLNVHAMDPDKKYCCSVQVRKCIVINGCGRGKSYLGSKMFGKVAAGLLHSYFFPFIWTSLDSHVKDYPSPLARYSTISTIITDNDEMINIVKSFMSKEEAYAFDSFCIPVQGGAEDEEEEEDDDGREDDVDEDNDDEEEEEEEEDNSGHEDNNYVGNGNNNSVAPVAVTNNNIKKNVVLKTSNNNSNNSLTKKKNKKKGKNSDAVIYGLGNFFDAKFGED